MLIRLKFLKLHNLIIENIRNKSNLVKSVKSIRHPDQIAYLKYESIQRGICYA
jgi:hypothetical protein